MHPHTNLLALNHNYQCADHVAAYSWEHFLLSRNFARLKSRKKNKDYSKKRSMNPSPQKKKKSDQINALSSWAQL